MEKYKKYTDEELVNLMENGFDLDEEMFFVLPELASRKPELAIKYCIDSMKRDIGFDEHFVSSALSTLYDLNEDLAIEFASDNFESFHLYSLGSLLSLLWVDSEIYKQNLKKEKLIKVLINHLKKLNQKEIDEIGDDYSEFKKAYKKLW